ncbi:MAG: exo-alpha-sialidase [Phycisphaeraceae bacterium]|nr:exo-alpha-sialidase [Phycisphaeraceae bacterium]
MHATTHAVFQRPALFAALILILLSTAACAAEPARPTLRLVSVKKIWDKAPHNAFTDLVRYRDRLVCAFREAPAHKGGVEDSCIRIISSSDNGDTWQDEGALSDERGDIRDAKLSIMPDGRLMLLTAIQLFNKQVGSHQSLAFFTSDLKNWDGPHDVGDPDYWLWGMNWHNDVGYTVGYNAAAGYVARLYQTTDGINYSTLVDSLDGMPKPNESSIAFKGDTAYCLMRVFGPAFLGTAQPPYDHWTWTKASEAVGGPKLIVLPTCKLLGGGRRYLPDKTWKTSLLWIDPQTAQIDEALQFPSGGDCSYPGMVLIDGTLYVSYYSSHEGIGHTSIYFARVAVEDAGR